MTRYAFYRWLRVLFGARSFVKNKDGNTTYVLISGNVKPVLVYSILQMGYVEEWEK